MPLVPAASETGDPLLLTPGPLTTSQVASRRRWCTTGARATPRFLRHQQGRARCACREIINGEDAFVDRADAGLGHVRGRGDADHLRAAGTARCWCSINGAYGHRAKRILDIAGAQDRGARDRRRTRRPISRPSSASSSARRSITPRLRGPLRDDVRHPEPDRGDRRARRAARQAPPVDAMSAFGALPLDARKVAFDAVAASSNKCIEGVPGLGFVHLPPRGARRDRGQRHDAGARPARPVAGTSRRPASTASRRRSTSSSPSTRRSRSSGPRAASPGRGGRYAENCRVLVDGMRALGFETLLPGALQAPIIVTFRMPADPSFAFQRFYDGLKERGYVIYPGKLTVADSFRIGCIGRLYPEGHARRARRRSPRCSPRWASTSRRRRRPEEAADDEHPTQDRRERHGRTAAATAFRRTPTVVVCIDGSEPGYIERAIETGLAPNLARLMRDRRQPPRALGDPELHQSEQPLDHHRPPAGRARHRRQLLLRPASGQGSDDERRALPARADTIMKAFHDAGAKVAVVTAKDKLRTLLGYGLDMASGRAIAFSSEKADKATHAGERHRRRARASSACRCRRSTRPSCPNSSSPPASSS